jgi:hypothetical protein
MPRLRRQDQGWLEYVEPLRPWEVGRQAILNSTDARMPVRVPDRRSRLTSVWLNAADVRRRG